VTSTNVVFATSGFEVPWNSGGTTDCPGTGLDVPRNRSGTALPCSYLPEAAVEVARYGEVDEYTGLLI